MRKTEWHEINDKLVIGLGDQHFMLDQSEYCILGLDEDEAEDLVQCILAWLMRKRATVPA